MPRKRLLVPLALLVVSGLVLCGLSLGTADLLYTDDQTSLKWSADDAGELQQVVGAILKVPVLLVPPGTEVRVDCESSSPIVAVAVFVEAPRPPPLRS